MKTIQAQFNHGRWIAICPKCFEQDGKIVALIAKPNKHFVCPEEYPDLLAKTLVPNPRKAGAFNAVPDEALRQETFQKAIEAGDSYEVIFPAEKDEIEEVLRVRPSYARSWFPGVSVAELAQENERMLAKPVVETKPEAITEPEIAEEPEPEPSEESIPDVKNESEVSNA